MVAYSKIVRFFGFTNKRVQYALNAELEGVDSSAMALLAYFLYPLTGCADRCTVMHIRYKLFRSTTPKEDEYYL
jgi:hypothetical protein